MFPFISKNFLSDWSLSSLLTLSSFWLFNQSKETTLGLFITFVLVSNLYLSMRSLSPENQPSKLPPDLTALVLTLFEVGGVDSMIAEKRGRENSHKKIKRCCKRWLNWFFLWERTSATNFKAKIEPQGIQWREWVPDFQREKTWPSLHKKHQKKQKITWSSHVIFD